RRRRGEPALEGLRLVSAARQSREALVGGHPPGVLRMPVWDPVVRALPADDGLPGLAASCTPARDGPLCSGLEAAARVQLGDPAWHLVSAKAEPVRYKPSSRCVIRYTLLLARTTTEGTLQRR